MTDQFSSSRRGRLRRKRTPKAPPIVNEPASSPGRRRWRAGIVFALLALLALGAVALACLQTGGGGVPSNAVSITVSANTGLTPWLKSAVGDFNASSAKTTGGKPVYVTLQSVEAGQAVSDIVGGGPLPALWIPDEPVWVNVLADKGNSSFQSSCVSVAQSPLVIAMWRPLAESLGWPGRPLGWLDVGSLAADPTAWAYYSGGQFGPELRLGHTHPGLSATGADTLLAVVQAAQSKTEAVSVEEVQLPIVTASVSAFEGAVSWFSKSTDSLGATMQERGISYLGAAVMYESTVAHYGGGDPGLVPIYPFEGTFVATHPACVNQSADSTAQEAAGLFRDYLLSEAAQKSALASGLRPVNSAVPLGSPLDDAHGVDTAQPAAIFNPPGVETLYAVQDIWRAARRNINLVMLIDASGSMEGDKIRSVQAAAVQFVRQMGDEDYITLIAFSSSPVVVIDHEQIGTSRDRVIRAIEGLYAGGNTTLYDAIGDGAAAIANTTSSQTTNAMVVLSDGLDTASQRYQFDQGLFDLAAANNTTVFTIAYGADADQGLLTKLALQANGNFYLGDEASIIAIYDEMSAAFGGSVGVGR